MNPTPPLPSTKTVAKSVRHTYTPDEYAVFHEELLRTLERIQTTEAELQQVKSSYKAKLDEAESRKATLCVNLRNGWEQRTIECRVAYRPADHKKDFYRVDTNQMALTEEMTAEDYQAELIEAESAFEKRETITLWEAGRDCGKLIIGYLKDRWYSALRCNVGTIELMERLDSEQRAFKVRYDAINHAAKRCQKWLKENLKDSAKGFEEPLFKAIEPHRERQD